MTTLPVLTWIGNAAAVLFGKHGAVSDQTRQAGCSRQAAYDHAYKVRQAIADAQLPGPSREQLQQELTALRGELQRLRAEVAARVPFGPDAQRRWAVTLTAWGLRLRQIEGLFAGLLGEAAPDHATVGRWTAAAGRQADLVRAALDQASRPRVRELALDELYFRGRPVLMAVEPHSLTLAVCRRSADCAGPTWAEQVRPFAALEYALSDGGGGLRAGLEAVQRRRAQTAAAPPLELARDVFHISLDGEPALRRQWRAAERLWRRAEAADAKLARARRQAAPPAAALARANGSWPRAARALAAYDSQEAAWRRAQAALRVFRPDGRLNDPEAARAEVAAACAALPGEAWAAVRRGLRDERTLTPLRRLHRRLQEAEPRAEVRQALVRLAEGEQQARQAGPHESGQWAVRLALQRRVCALQAADWEAAYARVRAALRGVVRASSCVECVNSVLRMHQGRHRQMPQGLLDLKRLWWNCHRFASGRRRGRCPDELLGLRLPTYDFWQLLQTDPQALRHQLKQELSTQELAA
jgi:hypothetical protein